MPRSVKSQPAKGHAEGRSGPRGWQRGQRDDLSLSEARHALWERRAVVFGCTLVFLATALAYAFFREPDYTAQTTLSVRLEEGTGVAEDFDEILGRLRESGATSGIVEEAAERAGWEAGSQDFDRRLERVPVNNEEVEVRFSAPTPEGAQGGADAYAEVFVERVKQLQGRLAGGIVAVDAGVEEAAGLPERRSGPVLFVVVAAAGGGGLLAGGIAALFLESRARRWRGIKDAELTLRAPVLGVIPDYSNNSGGSRDGGA